jgi:hypothetical protein
MARKLRELKAELRRAGATQTAQESSHTKWKHPLVPGMLIGLSGHDGDDAKAYQERDLREALRRIAEMKGGKQP